jgi:hypothetical protein
MLNGLSLCCMDAGRLADARVFCERLLVLTEREDNRTLVRARLAEIAHRLGEEPELQLELEPEPPDAPPTL